MPVPVEQLRVVDVGINTFTRQDQPDQPAPRVVLATSNISKYNEYQSLGLEADWVELDVEEIQNKDPYKVATAKAIAAWEKYGPVAVTETSLDVPGFEGLLISPYVKDWGGDVQQRRAICRILSKIEGDRKATMRELLAYYDGKEVHIIAGHTVGEIAPVPQGNPDFGFEEIFIPEAEKRRAEAAGETPRTYGQMDLKTKNETSPRRQVVEKLKEKPFPNPHVIFQLPEPSRDQTKWIRVDKLNAGETEDERLGRKALEFAYSMDATRHMPVSPDLAIGEWRQFTQIDINGGAVKQYKLYPESASQGLVVLDRVDMKRDWDGKSERIVGDILNNPVLYQMGPEQTQMALAIRMQEYREMHNQDMHNYIRGLQNEPLLDRGNIRSRALEKELGMKVRMKWWKKIFTGKTEYTIVQEPTRAIAASELAYDRKSSLDQTRSRKVSARKGLVFNTRYGPMSMLGIGGMPPTSGSKDVLVTSAMSYMQSWIPHNGLYVNNFDLQMQLFREAKEQIHSYGLDEDIEDICVRKVGLSIGSENPEQLAEQVEQFYNEGGRAVRIYTTNPDSRVLETAKAIRARLGERGKDLLLAVGTITDIEQARALKNEADVGMFIIGHGGGENCTSAEGGAAVDSVSLPYKMRLDPTFNDALFFAEGGIGENYGPLLGLYDGFSINKKGVGGIESTGGVYLRHIDDNRPVIAYYGTASVPTLLLEAEVNQEAAIRRLNLAAKVDSNEGKPNYLYKEDWVHSIVDKIRRNREFIGRALADQQSNKIQDFLQFLKGRKQQNVVISSQPATAVAHAHTGRK